MIWGVFIDNRKLLESIKKIVYGCGKIIVIADRNSLHAFWYADTCSSISGLWYLFFDIATNEKLVI